MRACFLLAVALAQCPEAVETGKSPLGFVEVPDPLSGVNPTYPLVPRPLPDVGQPFLDLRFQTTQVRATAIDGIRGRHEYSRHDPFNSNQSMILLDPVELWNVYRTDTYPYNQPSNLVRAVHLEEPRWDPVDPQLIWGVQDFSIRRVNVTTGQITLIKDFAIDPTLGPIIAANPVYRITMKDEGESSRDKRTWAFFLQGNDQASYEPLFIFTWDRQTDTVLGVYPIPASERDLDWVGMSVLGNWVVILGLNPSGNIQGLTIANRQLTTFHVLRPSIGHADVGLDTSGNEVVVGQNAGNDYVEMIPLSPSSQAIPVVRLYYDNGSPDGLQSGVHVSCNLPGYALISTTIEPGLPEQNWLDRSIVLVRLDPQRPRTFYLAKLYNTTGAYWEETHGSITNDGSRVVWSDNWGQNVGSEMVFLTQLSMPPNWLDVLFEDGFDGPL